MRKIYTRSKTLTRAVHISQSGTLPRRIYSLLKRFFFTIALSVGLVSTKKASIWGSVLLMEQRK